MRNPREPKIKNATKQTVKTPDKANYYEMY